MHRYDDVDHLKAELEQEKRYRETIEWSNTELERSITELEAYLLELEKNSRGADDNEWKVRFESQTAMNKQMQEQKDWLEAELVEARRRLTTGSYPEAMNFNLDALNEPELLRLVKHLERMRNDFYSTLRDTEWKLDKEGKEFHHFDEMRRVYKADLKHANHTIERMRLGHVLDPSGAVSPIYPPGYFRYLDSHTPNPQGGGGGGGGGKGRKGRKGGGGGGGGMGIGAHLGSMPDIGPSPGDKPGKSDQSPTRSKSRADKKSKKKEQPPQQQDGGSKVAGSSGESRRNNKGRQPSTSNPPPGGAHGSSSSNIPRRQQQQQQQQQQTKQQDSETEGVGVTDGSANDGETTDNNNIKQQRSDGETFTITVTKDSATRRGNKERRNRESEQDQEDNEEENE